jgi:hypothetical protein
MPVRCTAGISSRVAAVLAAAGNGAQLLLAVRAVTSQLEYSVTSSDVRRVQDRLADVHSCIVAVHDALDTQQHTTGLFRPRQRFCNACCAALQQAGSVHAPTEVAADFGDAWAHHK